MAKQIPVNTGITHVYYHGNCFDGFTAAWIALKAGVPSENLYPCVYGTGSLTPVPPDGARVLMVDVSYSFESLAMEKTLLEATGGSFLLIDHHKTAMDDIGDQPWAYFDLKESGASLAWKFFHPGTEVPRFVQYIREHDLWKFELPESEIVKAFIRSYPRDFKAWDELSSLITHAPSVASAEGKAILRSIEAAVTAILEQAVIEKIGEYHVPVVNATIYFSEVANELLKKYPEAPFAMYYMDRADGMRQFGLRSRKNFDCSNVAKRFGGGGHAQAAGFTIKTPRILT